MYAQAFDAGTLKVSGEAVRVADEVPYDGTSGRGQFSVSPTGVLAYFYSSGGGTATGQDTPLSDLSEWQMAWIGRTGQRLESVGPPGIYRGVEVSPDTTRVAVHRHDAIGGDVYIIEPRGSLTNLTQDATRHSSMPIWSFDGKRIVYAALKSGKWGLYQTLSSGSGKEELLFESDLPKAPMSWSKDDARIVFWVQDPKTGSDLWVLTLADKKAEPLIATPFNETHAQISPDGKWLAYASDSKDGRYEIYVKPFPAGSGGWQVSYSGGAWPRWRKDTKELFFHAPVAFGSGSPYPFGGPLYVGRHQHGERHLRARPCARARRIPGAQPPSLGRAVPPLCRVARRRAVPDRAMGPPGKRGHRRSDRARHLQRAHRRDELDRGLKEIAPAVHNPNGPTYNPERPTSRAASPNSEPPADHRRSRR